MSQFVGPVIIDVMMSANYTARCYARSACGR